MEPVQDSAPMLPSIPRSCGLAVSVLGNKTPRTIHCPKKTAEQNGRITHMAGFFFFLPVKQDVPTHLLLGSSPQHELFLPGF